MYFFLPFPSPHLSLSLSLPPSLLPYLPTYLNLYLYFPLSLVPPLSLPTGIWGPWQLLEIASQVELSVTVLTLSWPWTSHQRHSQNTAVHWPQDGKRETSMWINCLGNLCIIRLHAVAKCSMIELCHVFKGISIMVFQVINQLERAKKPLTTMEMVQEIYKVNTSNTDTTEFLPLNSSNLKHTQPPTLSRNLLIVSPNITLKLHCSMVGNLA